MDEPAEDAGDAEAVEPAEDAEALEPAGPGGPPRWLLVVVGLGVGVLIGAGLAWWGSDRGADGSPDDPSQDQGADPDTAVESPEAAAAFVEAWSRSRTATYLAGSLLERDVGTGVGLEVPLVVAQRPPDRVMSTGSSVQGTVDGERLACDEQLDGLLHCQRTDEGDSIDVERELEVLQGYFDGDLPLYRVAQDGDCFDLRLTRAVLSPPYGQRARFCFDPESGAPSLQRIEREEGTDVVTLVAVRTDVTDEDLRRVASGDVDMELLEG